ncbi:MAG: VWA domain-containing protein [Thermoanaerobaculia bacterium]
MHSRVAVIPVVVGLLLTLGSCQGCKDEKAREPAVPGERAVSSERVVTVEAENLTFDRAAPEEQIAPPEELEPVAVPPSDFSDAPAESEPNNELKEAKPLGRSGAHFVARGRLDGRDFDWYSFTIEGEPQLWWIEATGDTVYRLAYSSAVERLKYGNRQGDSGPFLISNLFLLPGQHWLMVESYEGVGDYTLRAVPMGPPDPYGEREPNDDASRAHLLRFGVPRTGLILEADDRDYYHFSLSAPDHIELALSPHGELTPRLTLSELSRNRPGQQIFRHSATEPGAEFVYEGLLPPGDYLVEVKAEKGSSDTPYGIRLARLDPFDLPTDLEPNDQAAQARPLPSDLTIEGTVGQLYGDDDWYRLPPLERDTDLTIDILESPDERYPASTLSIYREGENSRAGIVEWSREDNTGHARLTADTQWLVRIDNVGRYRVRFEFSDGPTPQPRPDPLAVDLSLPPGPHLAAAYWHMGQTLELLLSVTSLASEPLEVDLQVASSHHFWEPRLKETALTLQPGERRTVALDVMVAPDAWADRPVQITAKALTGNGSQKTATTRLIARCGAAPVNEQTSWPLPESMLGGLNLAWTGLGARPLAKDEISPTRQVLLHDGFTPNDTSWYARGLPLTQTVGLAGDTSVPIAGVLLNTRNEYGTADQARHFSILVSEDGREFEEVLADELSPLGIEQAFAFERPFEARFARLEIRSRQSGSEDWASLGEWKVVASPGAHPFGEERFNLADPATGGHIIWSDPLLMKSMTREILSTEIEHPRQRLDALNPNRWVVGFHHDRSARLVSLEWVQSPTRYKDPYFSQVQVAVSNDSPAGPWSPLGTWNLDSTPGSTSVWELPDPVWARFVRFSTSEPTEASYWHLAETLRILEKRGDDRYRSILGEWGQYGRAAIFESLGRGEAKSSAKFEADDNGTPVTAQRLEPGDRYQGRVMVGEDLDWYRLEVPAGHNRVRLEVDGDPTLRVAVHVQDETGRTLPLDEAVTTTPNSLIYDSPAEPGSSYYVRIEEPPRSIVLSWDNSGSTTPFKPTLYQALPQFVADVQPGREYVNLLPFRDRGGRFLLEEWSDQPYRLQTALQDYDRMDGSSKAEAALLTATEELAQRQGTRAVVFLTDADTHSYDETSKLWKLLSDVRPRVSALELHRGDVGPQQDLMQAWASVNEGHYDFFRTNADLEVAFDRASCHLRRPAGYFISASTRFEEPPGPGSIVVVAPPEEMPLNAVELILDASGSMLQKLEGRRRIDIAREVLVDLVESTIPAGTPLALRVFGHRTAGACQTDLEVPLQPLEPSVVTPVLRKTEAKNLAKTPIAQSLALVAEDLKGATGQKIIILVTDGEETCEGDPQAAIEKLKQEGFDVRVNIVGFAIEDEALKATFSRWAELGGGLYFNATSGEELGLAMRRALETKFNVIDAAGEVVAAGMTNGDPVAVPAGSYTVRVLTTPPLVFEDVRLRGDDSVELRASVDKDSD